MLVCANARGTEHFPLFLIGRAARLKCFEGLSPVIWGSNMYRKSGLGWKRDFFPGCIDSTIRLQYSRTSVVSLLDSAAAHGKESEIPILSNVSIYFLPPRTTSILQPLDQGVIASIKKRYQSIQLRRRAEYIDYGNATDA